MANTQLVQSPWSNPLTVNSGFINTSCSKLVHLQNILNEVKYSTHIEVVEIGTDKYSVHIDQTGLFVISKLNTSTNKWVAIKLLEPEYVPTGGEFFIATGVVYNNREGIYVLHANNKNLYLNFFSINNEAWSAEPNPPYRTALSEDLIKIIPEEYVVAPGEVIPRLHLLQSYNEGCYHDILMNDQWVEHESFTGINERFVVYPFNKIRDSYGNTFLNGFFYADKINESDLGFFSFLDDSTVSINIDMPEKLSYETSRVISKMFYDYSTGELCILRENPYTLFKIPIRADVSNSYYPMVEMNAIYTKITDLPGIQDYNDPSFFLYQNDLHMLAYEYDNILSPVEPTASLTILHDGLITHIIKPIIVNNDKFYFIGKRNSKNSDSLTYDLEYCIFAYDPVSFSIETTVLKYEQSYIPIENSCIVFDNNAFYICGGYTTINDVSTYSNKLFKIEIPSMNISIENENCPFRAEGGGLGVNGKLYFIGGYHNAQDNFIPPSIYDTVNKTWETKAFPESNYFKCHRPDIIHHSGNFYISNGYYYPSIVPSTDIKKVIQWNPIDNTFIIKNDVPSLSATNLAKLFNYQDKIYAIHRSIENFIFYEWNPTTDVYTSIKEIAKDSSKYQNFTVKYLFEHDNTIWLAGNISPYQYTQGKRVGDGFIKFNLTENTEEINYAPIIKENVSIELQNAVTTDQKIINPKMNAIIRLTESSNNFERLMPIYISYNAIENTIYGSTFDPLPEPFNIINTTVTGTLIVELEFSALNILPHKYNPISLSLLAPPPEP